MIKKTLLILSIGILTLPHLTFSAEAPQDQKAPPAPKEQKADPATASRLAALLASKKRQDRYRKDLDDISLRIAAYQAFGEDACQHKEYHNLIAQRGNLADELELEEKYN